MDLDQDNDAQIRQIADSGTFRSAPTMRNLLLYLWEHRRETVNDYSIATEALGRRSDFDPKQDSSVRVQIGRLRARLQDYYSSEGKFCPLRISVPQGTHHLEWRYVTTVEGSRRGVLALLGAALTSMLLNVFLLFWGDRTPRGESEPRPSSLPRFWQAFLTPDKPTNVILFSPLVYAWAEPPLQVRDRNVNRFEEWPNSSILGELVDKYGSPSRSHGYGILRDMHAAVELLLYLQDYTAVHLVESAALPVGASAKSNTVLVANPRSIFSELDDTLARNSYYIDAADPTVVLNRLPLAGEPAEFRGTQQSSQRVRCPGIIARLPTNPEGSEVLLLLGRFPTALISLLLSREGLQTLDEAWVAAGRPEAWETVVQADINGETVLKVWLEAFRPIDTQLSSLGR